MISLVLALALQEEQVFERPEEGIRLSIPAKGYRLRTKDFEFGGAETRCEIESTDGQAKGVLRIQPRVILSSVRSYADAREEDLRHLSGVKSLTRTEETILPRSFGEGLRRDWLMDCGGDQIHYVCLWITRGSRVAELCLWVDQKRFVPRKEALHKIAASVEFNSVWICGKCTKQVQRNEAFCKGCKTPVYPPHSDLEKFSKKNDIQIITKPSDELMKSLYPDGSVEAPCAAEAVLARFLPTLVGELVRYPASFFQGLDLERIIVGSETKSDGHSRMGLATFFVATILYPTREGLVVQDQDCQMVHHEILHFIDARDDGSVDSDPEWDKLNPWGFEYDPKTYANIWELFTFRNDLKGFVSQFAMSRRWDDKAETFGWLVTRPQDVLELAKKDKWIAKKIDYVKKMASTVSPQLDEKWWDSLLESK